MSRHGSPLAGRLEGRLDSGGGSGFQGKGMDTDSARRQDHDDLPAFRHGLGLDLGEIGHVLTYALQ